MQGGRRRGESSTTGAEQSTISAYSIKSGGAVGGDGDSSESKGGAKRCLMSYAILTKKKRGQRATELLIMDPVSDRAQ